MRSTTHRFNCEDCKGKTRSIYIIKGKFYCFKCRGNHVKLLRRSNGEELPQMTITTMLTQSQMIQLNEKVVKLGITKSLYLRRLIIQDLMKGSKNEKTNK